MFLGKEKMQCLAWTGGASWGDMLEGVRQDVTSGLDHTNADCHCRSGDKAGLRMKDCSDHSYLYGSENQPRHTDGEG